MLLLNVRSRLALLGMVLAGSVLVAAPAKEPAKVGAGTGGEPKEKFEVLELKLPKEQFKGTPKHVSSPRLEPRNLKRKPVMAPVGVVNLAAGKDVTASDEEPVIGDAELVTDGDKEGVDGSYVEFGPGVQHVTIDLGGPREIWAVAFWHFHSEGRVYRDVVVRVAADADFITGVETLFNNDHDNSAGLGVGKDWEYIERNLGRVIPAKGVKARYVRLYSNGNTSNDLNHYTEVEVYGTLAH